jgi:hypothetical protein
VPGEARFRVYTYGEGNRPTLEDWGVSRYQVRLSLERILAREEPRLLREHPNAYGALIREAMGTLDDIGYAVCGMHSGGLCAAVEAIEEGQ